jgi:hypothetical protein
MPERLDRVFVTTHRGAVELPWRSRDELLDHIRTLDSAKGICDAFAAVGASRLVTLTDADVGVLVDAINAWARNAGAQRLPSGVWGLRNALVDDQHDDAAE